MDTSRINELKGRASTVKNASQEGENSATRVGQLIYDIIDYDGQQSAAINSLENRSNSMQEQINDIIEGGGGGEGTAGQQKIFFINITHDIVPELPAVSDYNSSDNTFVHGSQIWTETNTNPGENQDTYMMWSWFVANAPQSTSGPVRIYNGGQGGTGSNGEDANEIEWIYRRAQIKPTAEILTQWTNALAAAKGSARDKTGKPYTQEDAVPVDWEDHPLGIDTSNKYEYASFRVSELNSNGKRIWGNTGFSEPILWAAYGERGTDGDGVEYIFYADVDGRLDPGQVNYPPAWTNDTNFQNPEYIRSGSRWVDEPVDLGAAGYGQGTVQWVSMRKKQDGVWQAYSEPAVWSRLGKDGVVDGYTVDLDNENMPVGTDNNGSASNWSNTALVQVYHNSTQLIYTDSSTPDYSHFTYSIGTITRSDGASPDGISATKNGANVVVSITSVSNFDKVNAYIPIIIALPNGSTRELTITVYGIASGVPGQFIDLVTGCKVIRSNYEGTVVIPTSMKVGVMIGEQTYYSTYGAPTGSAEAMGYYFAYGYDGAIPAVHTGDIRIEAGHSSITVNMYKNDVVGPVDTETIPYIKDGRNGDDGPVGPAGPSGRSVDHSVYYYVANTVKQTPSMTDTEWEQAPTDPANTSWSSTYPYLYCREKTFYTNGDTAWGNPFLKDYWTEGGSGEASTIYELIATPSAIKFYVDKSTNTLTPNRAYVRCKVRRTTGEQSAESTPKSDDNKYTIYYRPIYNDGSNVGYSIYDDNSGQGLGIAASGSSADIVAINFCLAESINGTTPVNVIKEISVPVSRDGLKGDKGEGSTGQTGKFYYFGGDWGYINNNTLFADDIQAPYVQCDDSYYMYIGANGNIDCSSSATRPPLDAANWKKITYTNFSMSDAMFSNNAHLGGMIINRDWVISQYGSINGSDAGFNAYINFDPIAFMNYINSTEGASIGVITRTGSSTTNPLTNSQIFKMKSAGYAYVKGSGTTMIAQFKSAYANFFRFDNSGTLDTIYYDWYSQGGRSEWALNTSTATPIYLTAGTYCFMNGGVTDIKIKYTSSSCFVPNYALDLRSGFVYQNNCYVSGTIKAGILYHSLTTIDSPSVYQDNPTVIPDSCGDIVLARMVMNSTETKGYIRLPNAASMEGRLLQIYAGLILQTTAGNAEIYVSAQESYGILKCEDGRYWGAPVDSVPITLPVGNCMTLISTKNARKNNRIEWQALSIVG